MSMFSAQSVANSRVQPGSKAVSSQDVGWTALLFEKWKQPAALEDPFQTIATPDQTIVVTASGRFQIDLRSLARRTQKTLGRGHGCVTAAFNTNVIRWQPAGSNEIETLHIYLPSAYLREAEEEYRRAGTPTSALDVDNLELSNSFALTLASSLEEGVHQGAPDLFADATARMFAVGFLLMGGALKREQLSRRLGDELTDRRLTRVLEYIRHNYCREIKLDELANEAGISRFHFVRLFRKKLQTTPYQYIVNLRLNSAQALLRSTDLDISAIAQACGYRDSGHFAASFRSKVGSHPSQFRRQGPSKSDQTLLRRSYPLDIPEPYSENLC